jgi:hypothetical protein
MSTNITVGMGARGSYSPHEGRKQRKGQDDITDKINPSTHTKWHTSSIQVSLPKDYKSTQNSITSWGPKHQQMSLFWETLYIKNITV